MAARIVDIARAAGIDPSTVSRALRGIGYVSPATKALVNRLAAEMNYSPDNIARSLALGRSLSVGVLFAPVTVGLIPLVTEIAGSRLRAAGYDLLMQFAGDTSAEEVASLTQLMNNKVAGIIAFPSLDFADAQTYLRIVNAGIRVVVIDRVVEGLGVPQIVGNSYQTGRITAEYLISLGHRNIVYLAIPQRDTPGRDRARGFRDAMSEAGIRVSRSSIIEVGLSEEAGERVMTRILKRADRPTAVIARHDFVAMGAMRAIYRAGLSIPQDISIVGNADAPGVDLLMPPLTTVHRPMRQIIAAATDKLLNLLEGNDISAEPVVLDVELVVRSSCAPPRSSRTS